MPWVNVDVSIYDPAFRGAALIHTTGSKEFNVGMRAWLKSFGWSFSQAGLKNEKGELLAAENEEEVFKKMGMPFVDPKNRDQFRPPAKKPVVAQQPQREQAPQPEEQGYWRTNVPPPMFNKLPLEIQKKVAAFKLPTKDQEGIPISPNFLYSKAARNQYYKRRGKFRIPDELKLERYLGGV